MEVHDKMEMLIPPHGGNLTHAAREYGLSPRDFLDFSANINPLGPSPAIYEAIRANLWQIRHYPDPDCQEIKSVLSGYLGVDSLCLMIGNGAAELIYLLARVLSIRRALIPVPTFSEYALAVTAAGGEVNYVAADEATGFTLPLDGLLDRLPGVDALFLCTPNNPTGVLIPRRDLEVLLDAAIVHRTMVIVDEAFMDFVPEREEHTSLPMAGKHPGLILLYSLTKFLAIPGLRLGALVAPFRLVQKLTRVRDPWSVNALAQVAGVAGLKDGDYMKATRALVAREREFLFQQLSRLPGLRPYPGAANFLLVDVTATGYSAEELVRQLGFRGILVRSCANFTGLGSGYIRLAVRGREDNLILLETLGRVLDGARRKKEVCHELPDLSG